MTQPNKTADKPDDVAETPLSRFRELCEAKQWDAARTVLTTYVDELKATQEEKTAAWRAYQIAGIADDQHRFHEAVLAYQCFVERFGGHHQAADALNNLGHCCLEIEDYAGAVSAWQKLIEEHDDSRHASWAWRQLAEAQTLQGAYDDAVATLEIMAEKYTGTRFEEYAQMRKGHVLSVAGREAEARAADTVFLAAHPNSAYGEEVQKRLNGDGHQDGLATENNENPSIAHAVGVERDS